MSVSADLIWWAADFGAFEQQSCELRLDRPFLGIGQFRMIDAGIVVEHLVQNTSIPRVSAQAL